MDEMLCFIEGPPEIVQNHHQTSSQKRQSLCRLCNGLTTKLSSLGVDPKEFGGVTESQLTKILLVLYFLNSYYYYS